jgi:DNA-binding transcriptional LysR family regulator
LDRFTGMAVFAKVAETASFAEAARQLDMSPAMVSKHVQTLEERLAVRLLNRTTRRVSVTEVGQNYYERCQQILGEIDDAERAAGDLQAAPRGRLRISAPVSFGMRQLMPMMAEYLAQYPDVSIDLNLNDAYVDLLEQRFDLAIRLGQLADSSLVARKFYTLALLVCASPDYLKEHDEPQVPSDLIRHNCLIYTYAASQRAWRFVDRAGREEVVRISGRFLANNGDALLALARRDVGIVLAPSFMVDDDIAAGRLVQLLPSYATPQIPLQAVYPHSQGLSAKTRTFIDFLAERFARWHQQWQHQVDDGKSLEASRGNRDGLTPAPLAAD